jgi:hypothetical protein
LREPAEFGIPNEQRVLRVARDEKPRKTLVFMGFGGLTLAQAVISLAVRIAQALFEHATTLVGSEIWEANGVALDPRKGATPCNLVLDRAATAPLARQNPRPGVRTG